MADSTIRPRYSSDDTSEEDSGVSGEEQEEEGEPFTLLRAEQIVEGRVRSTADDLLGQGQTPTTNQLANFRPDDSWDMRLNRQLSYWTTEEGRRGESLQIPHAATDAYWSFNRDLVGTITEHLRDNIIRENMRRGIERNRSRQMLSFMKGIDRNIDMSRLGDVMPMIRRRLPLLNLDEDVVRRMRDEERRNPPRRRPPKSKGAPPPFLLSERPEPPTKRRRDDDGGGGGGGGSIGGMMVS